MTLKIAWPPILVFTLVLLLTGCAPSPEPVGPAPVEEGSSSTPTASTKSDVRIVITANTLDVYEDEALIESWNHGSEEQAETAGLTELLGFEPTVTRTTGPCEGGPCDTEMTDWEGLSINTREAGPTVLWLRTTVAEVRGVNITAADGTSVGDDAQAISAANPDTSYVNPYYPSGDVLTIGVTPEPAPDAGAGAMDFVRIESESPFDVVSGITAPAPNYGA